MLERVQKYDLDITAWQDWFLNCQCRAIDGAQDTLAAVMENTRFWEQFAKEPLNARQLIYHSLIQSHSC